MEGNQQKMREALGQVRSAAHSYINAYDDEIDKIMSKIVAICDCALSKPARNCDLARDWLQDLYCKFKPPATVREMPPEWVDAVMAFCSWLLAPCGGDEGEGVR